MVLEIKQAINHRGRRKRGRGEELALTSSSNDAWGENMAERKKKTEEEEEMTCLDKMNLQEKRC